MASSSRKHKHQKSLSLSRTSSSLPKTEVTIHVYDLLPPGRLSTILWAFGGSLLHSGVVIDGREYAYGGHDRRGVSGVYFTRPKLEPPGGTFRQAMVHGFSLKGDQEIQDIINETSHKFQGTSYNLLSNNCNHFTSYLCEQLTGKPAPAWINRAASIGLALPCMVPQEWVSPPDHETADGELIEEAEANNPDRAEHEYEDEDDDGDDDNPDERVGMLSDDRRRRRREESRTAAQQQQQQGGKVRRNRIAARDETPPPRVVSVSASVRDSSGRAVPASERAPLPKR